MAATDMSSQYAYLAQSLPTPSDTPFRTPSRPLSRPGSRYGSSSPVLSSSPPPLPPEHAPWSDVQDTVNKDGLSILDLRRFTPSLHASLVSEILSLRRDLDSKRVFIDELENSLGSTRAECDRLSSSLADTAKDGRSLRRQLQLLEGGTASALAELARERDEAVEAAAEARRRLEAAQKKSRAEEDNAERIQRLWDRDKQTWENQRRTMERKVHVVEGRLKAILEEVAAQQAAKQARQLERHQRGRRLSHDRLGADDSDGDDSGLDTASVNTVSVNGTDRASLVSSPSHNTIRPMSVMSNESARFSVQYGFSGKAAGLSLAAELDFCDEEEEPPPDVPNPETQDNLTIAGHAEANRPPGVKLGLTPVATSAFSESEIRFAECGVQTEPIPETSVEPEPEVRQTNLYVDAGTQVLPALPPAADDQVLNELRSNDAQGHYTADPNFNIAAPVDMLAIARNDAEAAADIPPSEPTVMVSTSCQTDESLLAAGNGFGGKPMMPITELFHAEKAEVISSATQTDLQPIPEPSRAPPPPPPLEIPVITIYPPTSAPSSPGPHILPPHTKDVACQASLDKPLKVRSISVQTGEIRIDKRTIKLPPNLRLGLNVSSASPSAAEPGRRNASSPAPQPRRSSRRPLIPRSSSDFPSSPPSAIRRGAGGLAHADTVESLQRASRGSELLSAYDTPSSDGEDYGDEDWSGGGFQTALSAPGPRPGPETLALPPLKTLASDVNGDNFNATARATTAEEHEHSDGLQRSVLGNAVVLSKPQPPAGLPRPATKQGRLDRISNWKTRRSATARRSAQPAGDGANHNVLRSGSPAPGQLSGDVPIALEPTPPPYPVPTRLSSRKLPISISDGGRSPPRHGGGRGIFVTGRNRDLRRPPTKENLRKIRSSTAISQQDRHARPRSRSPPLGSPDLVSPASPPLPPLPRDAISTPRPSFFRHGSRQERQHSVATSQTGIASTDGSTAQNEIVDAIAQTMVGEWMWKYVRRRKSFGVPDSNQVGPESGRAGDETNVVGAASGVRHKRWVWLAPYERAVMWSSKQPTSGPALLGKSGRKLVIQSVLDVKDDTPSPRLPGGRALFNRSILILTSARALKFTATSRERHYVWLKALSFLSRPSLGEHDLIGLPPLPQQEYDGPARLHVAGLRRHPIRDSIRLAKGKARSASTRTDVSSLAGPTPPQSIREVNEVGSIVTAADPPTVPRFSKHGRHRSNTGGAPPLGVIRSFSHPPLPIPHAVAGIPAPPDEHGNASLAAVSGYGSGPTSTFIHRNSEASVAAGATMGNFFDASGTVRMEAFVRGSTSSPAKGHNALAGSPQIALHEAGWAGKQWNGKVGHFGHRFEADDLFRVDDPFQGF